MALVIASLNSGSNGNCYYIGNGREAVLVDAGISCGETEQRLTRLGLPLEDVKAIFISHEHIDHVRGVEVLSRRHGIPVYVTDATAREGKLRIASTLRRQFDSSDVTRVGGLEVEAFSKTHDAIDPHSFVVSAEGVRVGVFTDIGAVCDNVVKHFMRCHAAFLETNYDEEMLDKGRYPYPLKKRIRGGQGHLSNHQALDLFMACRPPFMSHLWPAHLSQDNNRPEIVRALFEAEARGTSIFVASRNEETGPFSVDGSFHGHPGPQWDAGGIVSFRQRPKAPKGSTQISLFD